MKKLINNVEYVWNPIAYDCTSNLIIYDPRTGKEYTEQEAWESHGDVRRNLCMRYSKIGVWTPTIKGMEQLRGR